MRRVTFTVHIWPHSMTKTKGLSRHPSTICSWQSGHKFIQNDTILSETAQSNPLSIRAEPKKCPKAKPWR